MPWYPSWPPFRFAAHEVEGHALWLQARLLRARGAHAAASADNSSFVLIDIGCNAGSFALFWAAAGFHAYCVDIALADGPRGGEFSWPALAAAGDAVARRLTLFQTGIAAVTGGFLAYAGDGYQYETVASLADAKGAVVRTFTAAELLGMLPGAFLVKIDIEGGEIGALRSLLDSGRRIMNIHVEITPGYWPAFNVANDEAAIVLARVEALYDVHVVFWREAAQVCCHSIFSAPPPETWEHAPLGFVQRLAPGALVPYVMQMAHMPTQKPEIGQRDFWLSEKGQDLSHMGDIKPLRCANVAHYADAFAPDAEACRNRHGG